MKNTLNKNILGQVISAQNILHVFDTEKRLADFLLNVLGSVFYIEKCGICLDGVLYSESLDCDSKCCLHRVSSHAFHDSNSTHFECVFSTNSDFRSVPFNTLERTYGHFLIFINDPQEFNLYLPFIQNLANSVALTIENDREKKKLNKEIAARKQVENKLLESERLHTQAQHVAKLGHWALDSPSGTPIWSEEIFKIFGLDPNKSEPSFAAHISIIHEEDWDLLNRSIQELSAHGKPFDIVFRIVRSSGEIGWMHAIGSAKTDEKGYVTRMFGTAQDITQLKKTEKILKESEENLVMAQAVAHIGSWKYDVKKGDLYWSDELFRVYGLDPNRMKLGLNNSLDMIHPEDKRFTDETFKKALREGVPYEIEYRIIRPNGDERHVQGIGRVERNQDGEVTTVYGTGQDITDRKLAEEALQESEKNYRELVENINDIIFKTDENGVFTFLSPLIWKLGFSPDDLIGKHFGKIIFPEDLDLVVGRFKALMSNDVRPFEYRIMNKSGKPVWIRSSSRPRFEGGKFSGIQGVVTDISEERRLKAEVLQAQKLEAIATLTGGIAHDYNNLLSIIVGNLGLAQQDAKPGSDQADFLKEAEKAARKVGDLTHELMALSRGGAPVKALGSIKESLKQSADVIPVDRGISVNVSIQEELWPVAHDSRKMAPVFRNVFQNALEAMPDGGSITLDAQNLRVEDGDGLTGLSVNPGDYVRISVQDNGSGISEENLDKIFDPYFSTKAMGTQKGMGLGLATAHAIVKKHGGEITVESTPDVGTTVNIYLPAQPEEGEGKDGKPVSSEPQTTAADQQVPMGRFLLMDDEEMLRNLAQQMLKRLGYEVETVKDGTEATEVYKKHLNSEEAFDGVILDLTIKGGMGGEQTLQKLLKIDPNVKAIVCSGYFNNPVMTNFQDYGFKGAMAKPYEMKDMKEVLETVL